MDLDMEEIRTFLRIAYSEAEKSPDYRTKTGAIIVSRWRSVTTIIGRGYNNFTPGIRLEDIGKENKNLYIEHAERNAIWSMYQSKFLPNRDGSLIMYAPWFACSDCAKAIVAAGITTVIGHDIDIPDDLWDRWNTSTMAGDRILEAAGVKTFRVKTRLGITAFMDGKEIQV